jgi:hypothetical protein
MEITKNIPVTIQVSDADTKECSSFCKYYGAYGDYEDVEGIKQCCSIYENNDTKGIRDNQCITDFGV